MLFDGVILNNYLDREHSDLQIYTEANLFKIIINNLIMREL